MRKMSLTGLRDGRLRRYPCLVCVRLSGGSAAGRASRGSHPAPCSLPGAGSAGRHVCQGSRGQAVSVGGPKRAIMRLTIWSRACRLGVEAWPRRFRTRPVGSRMGQYSTSMWKCPRHVEGAALAGGRERDDEVEARQVVAPFLPAISSKERTAVALQLHPQFRRRRPRRNRRSRGRS